MGLHSVVIIIIIMAKFHLASLLANKLANTSWPTSCRTSSHVVQQVRQLFCWLTCWPTRQISQHVEIETTSWPTFLLGRQYVKIYEYCLAYLLMSLKFKRIDVHSQVRIKLWTVRQFW